MMNKKYPVFMVLAIAAILGSISCSSGVKQEDYNALQSELNTTKSQLQATQSELNRIQGSLTSVELELKKAKEAQAAAGDIKYNELKTQYDAQTAELATIRTQLTDIAAKYDALKKDYDALLTGNANIPTEEIEQAIFKLINTERKAAGVPELKWGENLWGWARDNNNLMAQNGRVEYPEYQAWNAVFWASGYASADMIAKGTLASWKINDWKYADSIVNKNAIYGAVAVKKASEVYLITYIADVFK